MLAMRQLRTCYHLERLLLQPPDDYRVSIS
jgi:hypothetical protein